jgi:GST-like protein
LRIRQQKENDVIDVYTWTTGNSRKIPIFLEEAQVPYQLHMVNIRTGEQFKPEFVAICPNSKVPAIIDQDGPGGKPFSLFESGAILIYLADKYGKFIGKDAAERYRTIEWVMFQMANVGPLFGQANHFLNKAPEKMPYAIDRYVKESARLYKVLDDRLAEHGCAIRSIRRKRSTPIPTSSAGSIRYTRVRQCNVRIKRSMKPAKRILLSRKQAEAADDQRPSLAAGELAAVVQNFARDDARSI